MYEEKHIGVDVRLRTRELAVVNMLKEESHCISLVIPIRLITCAQPVCDRVGGGVT
jgi:hypothetical protein